MANFDMKKFLTELIKFNTDSVTKANYTECAEFIHKTALELGLKSEILTTTTDGDKPCPNVVITKEGKKEGATILLVTHFDIVPAGEGWSYDPFEPFEKDGKIFGRGASDDKGAIAAALAAMVEMKEPLNTFKLLATSDEEVGGKGIDYLFNEVKIPGDFAIVLDSGPDQLTIGASGILFGKILVYGKQGHTGYPFRSINAIDEARKILDIIDKYRKKVSKRNSKYLAPPESPRKYVYPRITVSIIHAGTKENIIPGQCEIRFDRRLYPEENVDEVEKEFVAFLERETKKKGIKYEYSRIAALNGYATDLELPLIKKAQQIATKVAGKEMQVGADLGGNDGHIIIHRMPVICFGQIRGDTNYHGLNEFVHIEDLELTKNFVAGFAKVRF